MSAPDDPSPRLLFEAAEIGHPRRARSGETLYRAGDSSPDIFFVVEGKLRLERITPAGPQPLGFSRAGDFAGAPEALLGLPRLGQAIAVEDARSRRSASVRLC